MLRTYVFLRNISIKSKILTAISPLIVVYLDFSVLVLLVMKDISTIAPLSHDLNFKPMPAKACLFLFHLWADNWQ